MWEYWLNLTNDQKIQARALSEEVRMNPSEFLYYLDEDDMVIDYKYVYEEEDDD